MSVCLNAKMTKRGFTIIEAIVAIFVITTGIVGVLTLVTQTISSATYSSDKLIAAYLAQEGIEIIRNIRDTNWLDPANPPWNNGLGVGGYQADYNDLSLSAYTGIPLNLENPPSNMYGYGLGTPTKFTRKITISDGPVSVNSLNIKVEVSWEEKGKPYKVEAQENLYNWK